MKTFRELPKEIQEKMLEEQVLQGYERNAEVFETQIRGGFIWDDTSQRYAFWYKIIIDNDFTEFYKMYPRDIGPTIKLTKQEIAYRLKIDIENLEIIE